VKSVDKLLDVLEIFWLAENEIGLSELARLSGLKRTTAGRIVSVLLERGYIKQSKKRGKYTTGIRSLFLSSHIKHKTTLREIAIPCLVELSEAVKESVTLFDFDSERPYLVEEIHTKTQSPLRVIPDRAYSLPPLYSSAYGKIFMASKTERELEKYFSSEPLQPYTPNSITDVNHYKDHLKLVSRENLAYDDEECYIGMRNVAVGIKNAEGKVVASVCVMGPSVRLSRARMIEIVPDVKRCAMATSLALGYRESEVENTISPPESKNNNRRRRKDTKLKVI
jgi:IclR family acetate operon transcriptional repressor